MITETVLSRSIRLMFAGSLALGMQVATAQEAAVQKVEVTGSRIPTLNTEGASPVTVLSAKDIKIDGARNVEDMLNNLPQVFASQGDAYSNGATGTSNVNLRGLGSDRTLVLVNGKRMPAGSVSDTAADLNQIPASLIQRIEVLTGGAGAIYGAGAVAGVVNFILKDNFTGVEVQANISGYNHKQHSEVGQIVKDRGFEVPGNAKYDGKTRDFNILMGGSFADGRGNATLFASYKKTDAILESQRDFTACALASQAAGSFLCSGSGTQASGRVGGFTNGPNGQVRAYNAATDAYNFGPTNYLQRPSEQIGVNARAHFDINENVRVYNEFNMHNYETTAQVAAGGIFFGIQATLRENNPLLSPAWKTALGLTAPGSSGTFNIGKRNVEGGARTDYIEDTSYRDVLGVKGEIAGFSYDIFGQFAKVNHTEVQSGYFSINRIGFAMDVTPDANGVAQCTNAAARAAGCIPYNLYQLGGVTQAMLNYLNIDGHQMGYTQQIITGGNVGTDLGRWGVKSPWASSGVGVSVGLERRAEKLVYIADEAISNGDMSGSGGASPSLTGGYSVKELFGEVKVPLLSKMPFADTLDLSGSVRRSEYSAGYNATTSGFGVEWAPIKQVRVRGSFQKAVRAPTIQDLYNPQSIGNSGPGLDPCEGAAPTATAAQCANSGVTAAQYGTIPFNSANQHSSQTGGNPDVLPETGKTKTLGVVITPTKDLTFTIDAFDISIEDTISSVDPTVALTQCLQTGNPVFCTLIKRDDRGSLWLSPNGPLGFVQAGTANIGSIGTKGFDLGANYRMKLAGMGSLDLTMNGTLLKEWTTENVPGLGTYDCTGYFGATCGTPSPKWRHKARATWATPWNFDMSVTWRHFGQTKQEGLSGQPLLTGEAPGVNADVNPAELKAGARNYMDLNMSYAVTKKISISGGVNNLLDKDPPILSTNATPTAGPANGNTFPQVYDANGRYIYLNVTARF